MWWTLFKLSMVLITAEIDRKGNTHVMLNYFSYYHSADECSCKKDDGEITDKCLNGCNNFGCVICRYYITKTNRRLCDNTEIIGIDKRNMSSGIFCNIENQ